MKKKEFIIVTILAIIFGTLMHFAYTWLGSPRLAGYFFPVDESVWEHMKMVFYPLLLVGIYMAIKKKDIGCISSMILTGAISIPITIGLFFSYWPFTHKSVLIFDCILYFGVLVLAIIFGNKWNDNKTLRKLWPLFLIIAIAIIILLGYLSYNKPDILYSLFRLTE